MTTLDDLRRAIAKFERANTDISSIESVDDALIEALRTAFEWRVAFTERWRAEDVLVRERDQDKWIAEEQEGMRLVREHLK